MRWPARSKKFCCAAEPGCSFLQHPGAPRYAAISSAWLPKSVAYRVQCVGWPSRLHSSCGQWKGTFHAQGETAQGRRGGRRGLRGRDGGLDVRNVTRDDGLKPQSARSRWRPRSRPTPARPGTGVIDWLALSSDWRYQLAGVIDEPVLSISQRYRPALKHAVPTARVSPAHPNPRAHAAHAPDSTQARNAAPSNVASP